MANIHEEEALGKAYDSRLMKRLITYLRFYKAQVIFALTTIVLKAAADVMGPLLVMMAVDRYLEPKARLHYILGHSLSVESLFGWLLSPQPLTGIAQVGGIYVFLLCFSFFLE